MTGVRRGIPSRYLRGDQEACGCSPHPHPQVSFRCTCPGSLGFAWGWEELREGNAGPSQPTAQVPGAPQGAWPRTLPPPAPFPSPSPHSSPSSVTLRSCWAADRPHLLLPGSLEEGRERKGRRERRAEQREGGGLPKTLGPVPSGWGCWASLAPMGALALLPEASSHPHLPRVRGFLREEVAGTSCLAWTPRPSSWKSLTPRRPTSRREGTSLPPQQRNS